MTPSTTPYSGLVTDLFRYQYMAVRCVALADKENENYEKPNREFEFQCNYCDNFKVNSNKEKWSGLAVLCFQGRLGKA